MRVKPRLTVVEDRPGDQPRAPSCPTSKRGVRTVVSGWGACRHVEAVEAEDRRTLRQRRAPSGNGNIRRSPCRRWRNEPRRIRPPRRRGRHTLAPPPGSRTERGHDLALLDGKRPRRAPRAGGEPLGARGSRLVVADIADAASNSRSTDDGRLPGRSRGWRSPDDVDAVAVGIHQLRHLHPRRAAWSRCGRCARARSPRSAGRQLAATRPRLLPHLVIVGHGDDGLTLVHEHRVGATHVGKHDVAERGS